MPAGDDGDDDDADIDVDPSPDGEDRGERNPQNGLLLERLLYKGVLPRYAFPTDVTTFHVFDHGKSSGLRHILSFAPSQGAPIALSQYAPGKQVWISGKCYTSGAIYSPNKEERAKAWKERKVYFECGVWFDAVGANQGFALEALGEFFRGVKRQVFDDAKPRTHGSTFRPICRMRPDAQMEMILLPYKGAMIW